MPYSQWSSDQQTEVLKTNFLNEVSRILEPSNAEGRSLLNYLQRTGKQLNIRDFDIRELISEAAMRGLALIDNKSEEIENTQAWLRKVCTFILYDMVKAEKKNRELKAKNTDGLVDNDPFTDIESDEQREALARAFSLLSKEEQEILNLRFYQGRKYKDIQQYYLEEASVFVKAPTLRKRESRAIQKLHKKFREEYE